MARTEGLHLSAPPMGPARGNRGFAPLWLFPSVAASSLTSYLSWDVQTLSPWSSGQESCRLVSGSLSPTHCSEGVGGWPLIEKMCKGSLPSLAFFPAYPPPASRPSPAQLCLPCVALHCLQVTLRTVYSFSLWSDKNYTTVPGSRFLSVDLKGWG